MGSIVWLASYPKSGNTWVRAFLQNYVLESTEPASINALTAVSVSECDARFFRPQDARAASTYSEADVQRMRKLVHAALTRLHDDLVFVKTHNAALEVSGAPLCSWEVTAGAIYVLRDPRDVAVSYAAYTGRSVDMTIDFMAREGAANRGTDAQVFEYLGSWSAHVESWMARPKLLVVRYEDLLAAPLMGFGRIVRFLGEGEVPAERLRRATAFSDFAILAAQEREEGYTAGGTAQVFFRKGNAGQWRDVLSASQVQRIEAAHGKVMRRFGYLESG